MNKIIAPILITPAKVVSSNVPASVTSAWSSSTTYSSGDYVVSPNEEGIPHEYQWLPPLEDLITSLNLDPSTHSLPQRAWMTVFGSTHMWYHHYWLDLGPEVKSGMFDGRTGAATVNDGSVIVEIEPGEIYGGVALVGVSAASVVVTMTDPTDGVVYEKTVNMSSTDEIVDYYSWFFSPIERIYDVILTDLPPYPDATLTVSATDTGETVSIGELVVGQVVEVGKMLYGSSVGIESYSMIDTDDQGVQTITKYPSHKTVKYSVSIETRRVAYLARTLAKLESTPAVFIGVDGMSESIVYGFYEDFEIAISGPIRCQCTYTVKELA